MEPSEIIDSVAEELAISSPSALKDYLLELATEAKQEQFSVENTKSVDLVEAAAYWVEGIEHFLEMRGVKLDQLTPWSAVAMVISAGLVYE